VIHGSPVALDVFFSASNPRVEQAVDANPSDVGDQQARQRMEDHPRRPVANPCLRRHRRKGDDMAPGDRSAIPKETAGQVKQECRQQDRRIARARRRPEGDELVPTPEDGEAQPEVAARSLVVRDTDDRGEEDEGR